MCGFKILGVVSWVAFLSVFSAVMVFFEATSDASYLFGFSDEGIYYSDFNGHSKRLNNSPSQIVPAPNGFIGVYSDGTYFVDLNGHTRLLNNTATHIVSAPNGFIGVYGDGTFFVDLNGHSKRLNNSPSQIVSAPNGFIGVYSDGTFFVDLNGHTKKLNNSPSQIVAAPNGYIGVYSDGTYYIDLNGKTKRLNNHTPQIVAAPNGYIGAYDDGIYFIDLNGNPRRLDNRSPLILGAPNGYIGVYNNGARFISLNGENILLSQLRKIIFVDDSPNSDVHSDDESIALIVQLENYFHELAIFERERKEELERLRIIDSINPGLSRYYRRVAVGDLPTNEDHDVCPICLEKIDDRLSDSRNPAVRMSCDHIYCEYCIKRLFVRKMSPMCAICRAPFKKMPSKSNWYQPWKWNIWRSVS